MERGGCPTLPRLRCVQSMSRNISHRDSGVTVGTGVGSEYLLGIEQVLSNGLPLSLDLLLPHELSDVLVVTVQLAGRRKRW